MKNVKIYKCLACGNIVYLLHKGDGELVCCEKPMELLKVNTTDASVEKHVPCVKLTTKTCCEKTITRASIQIGEQIHPMVKEHYIEWISICGDNKIVFNFLKPGDKPTLESFISPQDKVMEYCNIHGLWVKE